MILGVNDGRSLSILTKSKGSFLTDFGKVFDCLSYKLITSKISAYL